MIPYLKHKQEAAASTPVDIVKREPDQEQEYDVLESCADDILMAIEKKDVKMLASALKAAFELCDSEPHEEGEHI